MAKYKVNQDGVDALQSMASAVLKTSDIIMEQTDALILTADLGPHRNSLLSALAEIKKRQVEAAALVAQTAEVLQKIANNYLFIIGNDPFNHTETDGGGASVGMQGGGSQSGQMPGSLAEVKDMDGFVQYMEAKYGVKVDPSVTSLNFNLVKASVSGVESVIQEYPEVGENLVQLLTCNQGVMACNGSKVFFNPRYYKNEEALKAACRNSSACGHWPKNASPASIGVHEAGHAAEWALIRANPAYTTDSMRVQAWNSHTESGKIVAEACRSLRNTPYGQGKSDMALVGGISKYAMASDAETIAEAFADVYANGENANPLSIEIKRVMKEKMESYKGGK